MRSDQISPFQFFILLIHAQIGVGVISLSNKIYRIAAKESWISILIAGIIIQGMIFIYGYLIKKFPKHHLYDLFEHLLGKWLGKLTNFLYMVYWFCLAGILIAKYVVILKSWMMPETPKIIIVLITILLSVYAVKQDLQIIANFFTLCTFVIFIYIGLSIYALKEAHITNILPIGETGFLSIIKGSKETLYAFQGFELILLIFPFVTGNRRQIIKVATYSNIFIVLFYTFLTIVSILFFGGEKLRHIPEPILFLIKSFSFPIIERPDLLFTSFWIVLVVSTLIVTLYILSLGASTLLGSVRRSKTVLIISFITFLVAMSIYGEYQIRWMSSKFYPFIFLFSFGLPILLVFITIVKKRKVDKDH